MKIPIDVCDLIYTKPCKKIENDAYTSQVFLLEEKNWTCIIQVAKEVWFKNYSWG